MNLKELVYKIIPRLKQKNAEQNKLQEGIEAVQNIYEESETKREANEKAMNIVLEIIQEHPDMPVGEFLKKVQEDTDLSDNSLVEIIKQIPDIKSEKATVEAVKKVDLASEAITEIIQEAPVSTATAQKLVEQIPDEEIQKEQQAEIKRKLEEEQKRKLEEKENEIILQLGNIYNNCGKMNDNELIRSIEELEIKTRTGKINEKLERVIAKKVALDCMEFGGPKIPTLMRIIPATEMLEINLPILTEKEYNKIKNSYDEPSRQYREYGEEQKKLVKEKILENIAKEVAKNFEDIGDIAVPQIEELRKLNDEELSLFISTVKKSCREEKLKKDDIEIIKRQLRGDTVEEWKNLKRILEKMKTRDREKVVRDFMQTLKANENKTQQQKELDSIISDISTGIRKLPVEKQIDTAKAISNILEQQQQAIQTKEIKKNQDARKKGEPEK